MSSLCECNEKNNCLKCDLYWYKEELKAKEEYKKEKEALKNNKNNLNIKEL